MRRRIAVLVRSKAVLVGGAWAWCFAGCAASDDAEGSRNVAESLRESWECTSDTVVRNGLLHTQSQLWEAVAARSVQAVQVFLGTTFILRRGEYLLDDVGNVTNSTMYPDVVDFFSILRDPVALDNGAVQRMDVARANDTSCTIRTVHVGGTVISDITWETVAPGQWKASSGVVVNIVRATK